MHGILIGAIGVALALLSFVSPFGDSTSGVLSDQPGPKLLHAKAGSPYFVDASGRAVYLTGSHTWATIQDRREAAQPEEFDFDGFLGFLERYGHNFTRLWVWENASGAPWTTEAYYFRPMPYLRTGPGRARDGDLRFDVTRFNQAFFDRLRERVKAADERGIYVSVMLFQGWSLTVDGQPGKPFLGHPFYGPNNVNGINGDRDGTGTGLQVHSLEIPEVVGLQEAYVRKVVDTVNGFDNVIYEISNESHRDSTAWQYHMVEYLRRYEAGRPKQHPIGMTIPYGAPDDAVFESPADWVSPGSQAYRADPPAADGTKVVLLDTDHIWGVGGDASWVWKSFTRGLNPIYMDPYDRQVPEGGEGARRAMGQTLSFARRMRLSTVRPRPELASSQFCLADPGREYLAFLPDGGSVALELQAASRPLSVEWFNVGTGAGVRADRIAGGRSASLTSPFGSAPAVVYLVAQGR